MDASQPPPVAPGPFRFAEVLAQARRAAEAQPKRERTIAALRVAALDLLETGGWHDLSVERVTGAIGVARGTFYQYFRSGEAIALELVDAFEVERLRRAPRPAGHDPFVVISSFNRYYVEVYRRNAGLVRAKLQLSDSFATLREHRQRADHEWAQRVARSLARRTLAGAGARSMTLLVYAMQSMVDDLLREIWVDENPHLAEFADSPDEVADHLSAIWHRAAYGGDPEALGLAEGMRALRRR
jgi:AcrR family transcriptional regulator